LGSVKLSKKLNFELSVTDDSKVKFNIDGLEGSPALTLGNQANLNIVCSTGDFIFHDLEWNAESK